ncbi:HI_0552 family protein [Peribacillus sp. FSL H8-0477]|uniref:McrB family protein n=1 Tax=Peribacillus sp. FSL H8-0477 TaxID=2921388 RepID=UPI0030F9012E
MKIPEYIFEVFDRDAFTYRVKEEGSEKVKEEYTLAWNAWKGIVERFLSDAGIEELTREKTENWQNSGVLSKRFWTRIKNKQLMESPSCIAAMISKESLRIYLEWHAYKNNDLNDERKFFNNWVNKVDNWIEEQHIDLKEYKVWTNKEEDEDFQHYVTLEEFINNNVVRSDLMNVLKTDNKNWIRVGRVIPKNSVVNNENTTMEIGQTIKELEWIYKRASGLVNPDKVANSSITEKEIISNGPFSEIKESLSEYVSPKSLNEHIHHYIASKGFYYSKEEVTNLFLSIKTKPFVILSGISGTGKTKIVQLFAESVGATEENGQFTLIPIRPDWNDGSDLLGYVDIKGEFKAGLLTKVIEKAEQNPDKPYFLLLDEMNLARVEHYFSDVLSVMESRRWLDKKMVTSILLSKEVANRDIRLPVNLYIIGTVNMDETTHPFSKKVLDRANTIEFNRVELSNLSFLEDLEEVEPKVVHDNTFRAKYLHLKDLYHQNQKLVQNVTAQLERINKYLELTNAHIGYRVRDEICFYLAYNEESQLLDADLAFDHCILQKILPRISGSDLRVEQLLAGLYRLFTNRDYAEDLEHNDFIGAVRYPKSTIKVVEMLRRLRDDGFTSFWIS